MIEFWKDIIGYEGQYQVSDTGRVRSLLNHRILKQHPRDGYLRVALGRKKTHSFSVHRLVAQAFVPNPHDYKFVNHKDAVRHNNHASNLGWTSPSQNNLHASRHGSRKCKLNLFQAEAIRKKRLDGISQNQLAKEYKVSRSAIQRVLRNLIWYDGKPS